MARKSIDFSQSLLKFQSATNRTGGGTSPSSSQSSGSSQSPPPSQWNGGKNNFKENDGINSQDEDIEALKSKFAIQNRSLAKSNSVLSSRISDLEYRVSELINENVKLRKNRNIRDIEGKKQLEDKLGTIESNLFAKFNEIFQFLKNIRSIEELPRNAQLDILSQINRPVTSTPLEGDDFFPTTLDFSGFRPQFNASEFNEVNQSEESRHDNAGDQAFIEDGASDSITDGNKISTILEVRESESDVSSERIQETPSEPVVDLTTEESQRVEKVAPSTASRPVIRRTTKRETLSGTEIPSLKENQEQEPSGEERDLKQDILVDTSSQEEHVRPRRNRKAVDYKGPPLGGKMRRESVKMLDAVGDNVLINYVVPPKIKKENEVTNEKKRKIDSMQSQVKRRPLANITNTSRSQPVDIQGKRNPGNIVSTRDKNTKSSKDFAPMEEYQENKDSASDLSVFDFEEVQPRKPNIYVGKRGKSRRHTMLM
ncbi:uncharacterized protein RJT20DRAFT_28565 [Scheffersomyces xylosifermentans]|uniref:uncharacterized protein n=1 Tax=Scheffersomyces xylosifermentans TaxID=1304137 RepID=UPI00315C647E